MYKVHIIVLTSVVVIIIFMQNLLKSIYAIPYQILSVEDMEPSSLSYFPDMRQCVYWSKLYNEMIVYILLVIIYCT